MVLQARTANRNDTVRTGMIPHPKKLEAHVPASSPHRMAVPTDVYRWH
ncbi:MAG: hypothetical protein JWR11_6292 [Mycobacterium sp.]|jgi:hypothetical protein|nr:hypothetical protein [Mycobacterium sp.]MDT5180910.1 hypothetical protein [Mycobacterium sp.]